MKIDKEFLNKVIFSNKINQINHVYIKNWLNDFLTVSNIIIKLATIILGTLIFCLIYFLLRQSGLEGKFGEPVFNKGAAFGVGSNWPVGVGYFLKSLVAILFLVMFVCFNKWYCYTSLYFVFINALCLVIDKSLVIDDIYLKGDLSFKYDSVVDYFHFKSFVNNIGDIFVITFSVTSCLGIIWLTYKSFKNNPKD